MPITMKQWLRDMREVHGELLGMTGYDECIHGICCQFGRPPIIIYDLELVLQKLEDDGMTRDEAMEFWEFNQVGAGMGEHTPAFLVERAPVIKRMSKSVIRRLDAMQKAKKRG